MQRRHALQRLLRGLAAGSLIGPAALYAQQQPTRQTGVARVGASEQAAAPATRPAANFKISEEAWRVLQQWEAHTRNIERLRGTFDRYVYDSTFLVEKRAAGKFWYEAPDKGRIDFDPMDDNRLPQPDAQGRRINPKKLGTNGQPYTVQADHKSKWVCRGDALLAIDDEQRTYEVMEIPPHMQGRNIANSPLPFLFGMTAQEMDRRYYISLGTIKEYGGRPVVNIVAAPRLPSAAKEWSRAEVLLDPGTYFQDGNRQPVYVPIAIKLLDPTGQTETVYFFRLDQTKLNEGRLLFGKPFEEPNGWIRGYKCTGRHRVAVDPAPERKTVEIPQPTTPQGVFK